MENSYQRLPEIDRDTCIQCGACAAVCPTGAITGADGVPDLASPSLCTRCSECEETCPTTAITLPFTIGWAES